jgi:hypothetical protein
MNRELLDALSSVAFAAHADLIKYLDAGGPLHSDYVLGQRILVNIEELQRLLDQWRRLYPNTPLWPPPKGDDDLPF